MTACVVGVVGDGGTDADDDDGLHRFCLVRLVIIPLSLPLSSLSSRRPRFVRSSSILFSNGLSSSASPSDAAERTLEKVRPQRRRRRRRCLSVSLQCLGLGRVVAALSEKFSADISHRERTATSRPVSRSRILSLVLWRALRTGARGRGPAGRREFGGGERHTRTETETSLSASTALQLPRAGSVDGELALPPSPPPSLPHRRFHRTRCR